MNVIIMNENVAPSDKETLFGDEDVIEVEPARDLPNLLVKLGVYKSTSESRRANRVGKVPTGWTEHFKASRVVELFIWNPTEPLENKDGII